MCNYSFEECSMYAANMGGKTLKKEQLIGWMERKPRNGPKLLLLTDNKDELLNDVDNSLKHRVVSNNLPFLEACGVERAES